MLLSSKKTCRYCMEEGDELFSLVLCPSLDVEPLRKHATSHFRPLLLTTRVIPASLVLQQSGPTVEHNFPPWMVFDSKKTTGNMLKFPGQRPLPNLTIYCDLDMHIDLQFLKCASPNASLKTQWQSCLHSSTGLCCTAPA